MNALVRQGLREAKAVTLAHAKSFSFASALLFGERRRAAFVLYAVCRRLDDLVDEAGGADVTALGLALDRARLALSAVFEGRAAPEGALPWSEAEQAAFRNVVERFQLQPRPFLELVEGMAMDLRQSRYASFSELSLYCYRVAGTVGEMMAPVLGCVDPGAHWHAARLGEAMQLTNILRDVGADLDLGRVYLPQDELAAFGVTEDQLALGRVTPQFIELMKFQIDRARTLYAEAAPGIAALQGFGAQRTVRVMSAVYGGILGAIEAQQYDVFRRRAQVPLAQKLRLAAGALFGASAPSTPLLAAGRAA